MNLKNIANCSMSPAARLAICVGLGTSLTVSTGAAVGICVAVGLWLALTLGDHRG